MICSAKRTVSSERFHIVSSRSCLPAVSCWYLNNDVSAVGSAVEIELPQEFLFIKRTLIVLTVSRLTASNAR